MLNRFTVLPQHQPPLSKAQNPRTAFDTRIIGSTITQQLSELVSDPQGAASGRYRISRGGSWNNDAEDCVVGRRDFFNPGFSNGNLGFRVACRP